MKIEIKHWSSDVGGRYAVLEPLQMVTQSESQTERDFKLNKVAYVYILHDFNV